MYSKTCGACFIEVVSGYKFSANFTIQTYRHLSATLNGKWCAVRGQTMPETIRSLDFNQNRNVLKSPIKDPFRVDLKSLQLALDYLEITARLFMCLSRLSAIVK